MNVCTVKGCTKPSKALGLCATHWAGQWKKNNLAKALAIDRKWKVANRVKIRATDAKRRADNLEKFKARELNYDLAHRGHRRLARLLRAKRFPEREAAWVAARAARKLQATPAWANPFFIGEAYDLAKRRTITTGFKWHVDHTVPLRSPLVCGLHVESNLQVIPAVDNFRKNNRIWPDMPEQGDAQCQKSCT